MTPAQARYAALPEWVKAIIERNVAAENARPKPDNLTVTVYPRDVVNTDIKLEPVRRARGESIREVVERLRADGETNAVPTVASMFGCGETTVGTALKAREAA